MPKKKSFKKWRVFKLCEVYNLIVVNIKLYNVTESFSEDNFHYWILIGKKSKQISLLVQIPICFRLISIFILFKKGKRIVYKLIFIRPEKN